MRRPTPAMKICSKCNARRRSSSFYVRPSSSDGLDCWCKTCRRKTNAEYRRAPLTPEQREAKNAYLREYRLRKKQELQSA